MTEDKIPYTVSKKELDDARQLIGMDEPHTIVQETSGFTIVFDTMVDHYKNPITPYVYGVVRRYCQMQDNVCKASLETLGKKIGIDRATVMRHIKSLCDDGYLSDLTPDLRNKPHVYVDMQKVAIKNKMSATVAQDNTSVAQRNVTVAENQLNRVLNKDINRKDSTAEIFKTFENNICMLTPMLSQRIGDALDTYPAQWILDAIGEAVKHNARNWAYIEKILKTWKARGRANDKPLDKMSDVDKELLRMDIKPAHQVIEEMGLNDVSDEEQKIKNQKTLAKIKETE